MESGTGRRRLRRADLGEIRRGVAECNQAIASLTPRRASRPHALPGARMNPDIQRAFPTRTVADRVVGWFNPDRGLARLRSRAMLAAAATGAARWRLRGRPARSPRDETLAAGGRVRPIPTRCRSADLRGARATLSAMFRLRPARSPRRRPTSSAPARAAGLRRSRISRLDRGAADAMGTPGRARVRARLPVDRFHARSRFCRAAIPRVSFGRSVGRRVRRAALSQGCGRRLRDENSAPRSRSRQQSEPRRGHSIKIAGGVEVDDKDGVPQAYHVSDRHPGALAASRAELVARAGAHAEGRRRFSSIRAHAAGFDARRAVSRARDRAYQAARRLFRRRGARGRALVVCDLVYRDGGRRTIRRGRRSAKRTRRWPTTRSSSAPARRRPGAGRKGKFAIPARPNAQFDPFFLAFRARSASRLSCRKSC
jgi:hypothetical protein